VFVSLRKTLFMVSFGMLWLRRHAPGPAVVKYLFVLRPATHHGPPSLRRSEPLLTITKEFVG
jgi:hypothetical protein